MFEYVNNTGAECSVSWTDAGGAEVFVTIGAGGTYEIDGGDPTAVAVDAALLAAGMTRVA